MIEKARVLFLAFSGIRVQNKRLLELGYQSVELRHRAYTIASLPSLGLLTLAGMTPESWESKYHEFSADTMGVIQEFQPDLIAFSTLTASVESACDFVKQLHGLNITCVIGGLAASTLPMATFKDFDSIIQGDGESSWSQVLDDCLSKSLKKVYKNTKPYNFNQSPIPKWELLGQEKRARYTVQTQRGCSKACSFCGASRLLGPLRFKKDELIAKELFELKKYTKAQVVELADDNTFALGTRDALFDALEASKIRYFTEAEWSIGENPEILSRLSKSGCVQVLVGVESSVQTYSGMGNKVGHLDRIFKAIDNIQKSGVSVIACFIVGVDGETKESIENLGDIIVNSGLSDVQITLQTPFPGTRLYKNLYKQGRLLKNRSWSYYTLFDVTFEPSNMSVKELENSYYDLMKRVYSNSQSEKRKLIRKQIWKIASKLK
ncbi:MAG: radical SAM protein [Candidatus Cloacimonetes bacterium]|nr:radical SAM protein [Candidatus Cloacimonadota bacterium]